MNYNRSFILIFISILSIFSSCTFSNERKSNVITDSLIKATEDIAIGETRFGISEQEFNQLHPDSLVEVGGRIYNITSYFNKAEKLNMVYLIDTATIENAKFDQALFDKMDLLKQHFVKTYGEPKHSRGYPKRETMRNGQSFDAYIWKIGKKKIAVGLALEEAKEGNIYYVVAHVDRRD
ncbi:hypothetical protein [Pedobacter helvus]|uniref:Lipoprotein n=1 Tax=Pedobacter helvus TaxID=2563444 RepID=A0ABW9JJD6_9SPHI|nr:hypothetical protein [Pedobacter ureilyticus]